ncbi:polysaccharide deacetylase family protein [Aceticella autotrophica]|uniref:Polysaccharide deacetylase family protein n=1 Tax=Aceticella autotrophica TaxID=2755338 RepID=A0A975GB44_9THEO|nr:polysaccharide deacetylase family protein [Aceticella autotrophica]QSZ28134.1 polysaccharide deacetylase family protein [Aceticella autotrophica]
MFKFMLKIYIIYLILVAFLPTLLGRIFHYNVIYKSKRNFPCVSITFDDGPDPLYTPILLSLLDKYKIKACFFLLADKVEKYPELSKKIVESGHEIGVHGYKHHINWFLGPKATYNEFIKSIEVIKNITGKYPSYYRPPWGLFTLFVYRSAKKLNMKIVLWSYMSWDWKVKNPDIIVKNILKKIKSGQILIFHDSSTNIASDKKAPGVMIKALEDIIKGIQEKNIKIVDINQFIFTKGDFNEKYI